MSNYATDDPLIAWAVYSHPLDYPDNFVARRFEIHDGELIATEDLRIGDTLELLRAQLPPGLHRLARRANDEPQIVEIWL